MSKRDISRSVLEHIQSQGIAPVSRWKENLHKTLVWVLLVATVSVGALAASVIFFFLESDTWELYRSLGTWFILRTLPYVWFVALGVFMFFGKYLYHKTTLGHRRRISTVIGVYVILSVLGGAFAYQYGVGAFIERQMEARVPIYEQIGSTKTRMWNQPEQGVLSGVIRSVRRDDLVLDSFAGVRWVVNTSHAEFRGMTTLLPGVEIKLLGEWDGDDRFLAREIRPWKGKGAGNGNRMR